MGNHVHLLIKESGETLAQIMKRISSSYVYYYNHKYGRIGHLFQNTGGAAGLNISDKRSQALGFSIGWTAGAIISGAYFGDMMSPLSDTTVMASSMYKDAYLDNGYEPKLLSRTIEDSATVTSPIIPWTTCGMTQANVLGVSTLTYAPYCIFNYLSPVVTVIMALRVKSRSHNNCSK